MEGAQFAGMVDQSAATKGDYRRRNSANAKDPAVKSPSLSVFKFAQDVTGLDQHNRRSGGI